ncbi:MAG TPA: site-specific integrase [Chloroflexota bacterium]|nr:site-specific integrase [Chloroflexota bacterium]
MPLTDGRVKSQTFVSYRLAATRLPDWLGTLRLDELKPSHFQRFYQELTAAGLAPRTVRQTHTVLHNAMQDALPLELLHRNPTDGVTLPRIPQTEMNWYTTEQLSQLFRATEGERFHALWVTLGLRLGEALGLQWSDIDWERGTVALSRALGRDRRFHKLALTELKTKYSRRTLRLSNATFAALRAHKDRQDFDRKRNKDKGWTDRDLVFCTIYGAPLNETMVHQHWTAATRQAELPRYRVHDLRHAVASNLLLGGLDMMKVARMVGHRNAAMVLAVYGHLLPDAHQEAAAVMDTMLSRTAAI